MTMLNQIIKFDVFLLFKIFQKFAHWFQEVTGKNNFWLARVVLCLGLIGDVTLSVFFRWRIIELIIVLDMIVLALNLVSIQRSENVYGSTNGKFLNPEILNGAISRIMWIVIAPLLILIFPPSILYCVGILASNYFSACTPKPPAESKVKAWLKSFFTILKPAEVRL